MGINKTLEVVDTRFGAKLIIKTKDEQLPTAQRAKLLDAIKVAVDMLSVAGTKLTKWPWPELERSVLETHFRIGERRFRRRWAVPGQEQLAPGGPGREADLGGILEHGSAVRESRVAFQAITVMENFKKLRDVLKGNLKIADSYSSTFQFELQKAKTQNEAVLGYLKGEAEADFDGKGDYAAWAETQKAREAEYNKFLSDRDEREKSQATRLTEAENGYVKPHKPSLHKRPKEAKLEAPPMLPEEYGSIHINFKMLLERKDSMKAAITLIHEASHKFLDTLDFAYVYETKYRYMSTDQALRNADSYAFAAASLFCGKLMCSDADIA